MLDDNPSANSSMRSTAGDDAPRVKLPPLELIKFSGRRADWPNYWTPFEASIDSRTDLQEHQKFQYLDSTLPPEVAKIIAGVKRTDAGYKIAKDMLLSHYGDKDELIHELHLQLTNLKPARNAKQMIDMQMELESTC